MKKNFHPKYHTITVRMLNGQEFTTKSTWGKPGDVMTLEIDMTTHPAWTKQFKIMNTGRTAQFNQRFGSLGI